MSGETSSGPEPTAAKGIRQRTFQAGLLITLTRGLALGLGSLQTVILARLLLPEDFGLFGVVIAVMTILEGLSVPGFGQALIQRRGSIEHYLDVVWTAMALRGIGLGLSLLVLAYPLANFFGDVRAAPMLMTLAALVVLRGFHSLGLLLLARELNFGAQLRVRVLADLSELVVAAWTAWVYPTPWALLLGLLAGRATTLVLGYVIHPYRPRLAFNRRLLAELRAFGRWWNYTMIVNILSSKGDSAVIAAILGAPSLGCYMLAKRAAELITREAGGVVERLLFPVFSQLQGDPDRLRRGYLTSIDLVTSISLPPSVVLIVLSEPLVHHVLGEKWADVVSLLPPLTLAGILLTLNAIGAGLLRATGGIRSAFLLSSMGSISALLALLVFPFYWGLTGVGFAQLIGAVVPLPFLLLSTRAVLALGIADYAKSLLPGTLLAALVAVASTLAGRATGFGWSGLAACLFASLATYAAGSLALWKLTGLGPGQLLGLARRGAVGARRPPDAEPIR